MKISITLGALLIISLVGNAHAYASWPSQHPFYPTVPMTASFFAPSPFFQPMAFAPFFQPSFVSPFGFPTRSPFFPQPRFQRPSLFPFPTSMMSPKKMDCSMKVNPENIPKQQKKECEILLQQTPKYKTEKRENGEVLMKISLPHVEKESISLDLDHNLLKLRALIPDPSQITASKAPSETPSFDVSLKVSTEVHELKVREEGVEIGLVVTDVEEEEEVEEKEEVKEEKQETVKEEGGKGNSCVVKKEYILSLRIPKNINNDLLTAQFEEGALFVHFPAPTSDRPSRPILIQ